MDLMRSTSVKQDYMLYPEVDYAQVWEEPPLKPYGWNVALESYNEGLLGNEGGSHKGEDKKGASSPSSSSSSWKRYSKLWFWKGKFRNNKRKEKNMDASTTRVGAKDKSTSSICGEKMPPTRVVAKEKYVSSICDQPRRSWSGPISLAPIYIKSAHKASPPPPSLSSSSLWSRSASFSWVHSPPCGRLSDYESPYVTLKTPREDLFPNTSSLSPRRSFHSHTPKAMDFFRPFRRGLFP